MTFPSYILTETLFSFLLLAFVLAAVLWLDKKTQRFAVGAGACLGLAILCRANLLPLVLILPALVLMPTPASLRLDNSIRLKGLLAMMVTSSLILAPWCIRNSLMYGRPMLVTNAGGELFWRGNTPIAWALLGGEDVNRENAFREMLSRYGSPTSPIDVDRAAYKEGFNYWQESPAEAVWLKASMFCQMWRLWPTFRERNELALSPQSGVPRFDIRGVKIAWYAAFDLALVLGVFGSINKRFDPRIRILLSLLITATAVGVLYYCDLRHRYPYDLALFQLAAVGAASLNLAVFSKLTFERGRAS
jgi:hypothetical protein